MSCPILNLNQCISESKKALSEKGKLIIVESCVPKWFYFIEKILFKPSSFLINKFFKHPPAFQYTKEIILEVLRKNRVGKTIHPHRQSVEKKLCEIKT